MCEYGELNHRSLDVVPVDYGGLHRVCEFGELNHRSLHMMLTIKKLLLQNSYDYTSLYKNQHNVFQFHYV